MISIGSQIKLFKVIINDIFKGSSVSRGSDGQLVGLDNQASNPSSGIASNFNDGVLLGEQGNSFSQGGGQAGGGIREAGNKRGFSAGGSLKTNKIINENFTLCP